MTVTLQSGRKLNVHFMHSSHDVNSVVSPGTIRAALNHDAKLIGRRLTLCDISEVAYQSTNGLGAVFNNYRLVGRGIAICHPNDEFKKPVGRKVALTNALASANLSLGDRVNVWDDYLVEFGIVKAKPVLGAFDGAKCNCDVCKGNYTITVGGKNGVAGNLATGAAVDNTRPRTTGAGWTRAGEYVSGR